MNIKPDVLQTVMVLLVNEDISCIYGYMEPLDGYRNVYLYTQGGQQTEPVTYYIGKYGACPVAVRKIPPVFQANYNASTVVMMADQCFPNLGAVISVGVACGIKRKAQICDVLVSSKILNYDYDITVQGYLLKGEAITVSTPVVTLFTQPVQWPNYAVEEYSKLNRQRVPNVKSGVIVSGPCVVDPTKSGFVRNFADEVIGIEMDGVNLFAENQHVAIHTIIVKAVCDFGDGTNITVKQPIAALLAANLVHAGLSHPQAHEILKG